MADEDLITVTNNENPPINLEIVSYKNEVGVTYIQGKGDKGDTGEKGDAGEKGDKGNVGVNTMLVSSFTGSINGSNTTFVLNDNYDDIIVFINGIKYGSADYSYTKSTKTVVFGFTIPTGYSLEFYGITNKTANVVPLEDLSTVATSGSYQDLTNKPSIPSKTSDLTNDSNFVSDSSYVHTDNNLTNALKSNYDTSYTNSHTHSNSTALNNVSGTNTGDETVSTIKSKLGISTLSGSNTGDQDLSGLVTKTTAVNGKALNSNITVGHYSLFGTGGYNSTVNASTTYYFGGYYSSALETGSANDRLYATKGGTLTSCYAEIFQTGLGNNATSSLYIRVNDTTDYLVSNAINNNVNNSRVSNTSLSISLNTGDYFCFKWITPAWTTAPTGVKVKAQVGIDL